MTSAKLGAIVMTALLVMYVALLANTGIRLIAADQPVAKAMGVLILAFPLFGAWAIIREFMFALQVENLVKRIEAEGTWPRFNFELRPSGRPIRASADAEFEIYKSKTEADPDDFHNWFSLGLAYDATGDRRRARAAMRKAVQLSR